MRRRSRTDIIGLAAALLCVSAATAVLGQEDAPITLPAPTGPYAVGRVFEDWVDEARIDTLAPEASVPRELPVMIWYPADGPAGLSEDSYLSAPLYREVEARRPQNDPLAVDYARVRSYAQDNAPIAGGEERFPVVVLKPGFGAFVAEYAALAEELASHGYVVVGSDSPYTSAPFVVYQDGRTAVPSERGSPRGAAGGRPDRSLIAPVVETLVADMAFVLTRLEALAGEDADGRFAARLDVGRAGAFGHSFGGAIALQFCSEDARCDAAVNLDGAMQGDVVRTGMSRPYLLISSDRPAWTIPPESRNDSLVAALAPIEAILSGVPNRPNLAVIKGAAHANFGDFALFPAQEEMRASGELGPIASERAIALARDVLRVFFDEYLKGGSAETLEELGERSPELLLR